MGYAQYIQLEIINKTRSHTLTIKAAALDWGKFYANPNKDSEISSNDQDNVNIAPQTTYILGSCGRENAASGTQGHIELWETASNTKIGKISWDNPWLSGATNTCAASDLNEDWLISIGPYDAKNASIGTVQATVGHLD